MADWLEFFAWVLLASSFLWAGAIVGAARERRRADGPLAFLRRDNTRLRAQVVALERELDAERLRHAPRLRVVPPFRGGQAS